MDCIVLLLLSLAQVFGWWTLTQHWLRRAEVSWSRFDEREGEALRAPETLMDFLTSGAASNAWPPRSDHAATGSDGVMPPVLCALQQAATTSRSPNGWPCD